MILLSVLIHVLLDLGLGWSIISISRRGETGIQTLALSILIGMFVETMVIFVLMWSGLSLNGAVLVWVFLTVAIFICLLVMSKLPPPAMTFVKPRWYEYLVGVLVLEKVVFAGWWIGYGPVAVFYDGMSHWLGRGKALFTGINWSFDPNSIDFMGISSFADHSVKHYPLLIPIWKAALAVLHGSWDDALARVDGLVLFVILVILIWSVVYKLGKNRFFAAVAVLFLISLPLQAWHASIGYADLAVEVFVLASLVTLIRRQWFLSGLLLAGAIWSKNDALVLFAPAWLVMIFLCQFSWSEVWRLDLFYRKKWLNVLGFLSGLLAVLPWLLFKLIYSLQIDPSVIPVGDFWVWRPDLWWRFWTITLGTATSGIFWAVIFLALIWAFRSLIGDRLGRILLLGFLIILLSVKFIFCFTYIHMWMENQVTIHRTMMQLSGMATVLVFYAISLKMRQGKPG